MENLNQQVTKNKRKWRQLASTGKEHCATKESEIAYVSDEENEKQRKLIRQTTIMMMDNKVLYNEQRQSESFSTACTCNKLKCHH